MSIKLVQTNKQKMQYLLWNKQHIMMKRYTKMLALLLAVVLLAAEAVIPVSANVDAENDNTFVLRGTIICNL